LDKALPLSQTSIVNTSRYRVKTLPGAGALLKNEDRTEQQLSLLD
jgi:DNA gyrase subunit A